MDLDYLFHFDSIGPKFESAFNISKAESLSNNFGHRNLLKRRELSNKSKGYSLRRVAERVGIEPSYLSRIETQKVPPPGDEIIRALARELGEDEDALLLRAGRFPKAIEATIMARPSVMIPLIKALADAPEEVFQKISSRVRDGEW
jgi:transcriptional regulator with XRE-family HTH domain